MRKFLRMLRSARYMGKGEGQSKKGNYEKALEYYHKSLEYDEDPLVLYYCIAHSLAKLSRYEEARIYIDKSLEGYEQFENQGGSLPELKEKINEVLTYVDYMENHPDDRSH